MKACPGAFQKKPPKPEAQPVKKIRLPLVIVIALIGAFTLYSEQKHQSLAEQGKNIFRNDNIRRPGFLGRYAPASQGH
jgi:hypothetical protein